MAGVQIGLEWYGIAMTGSVCKAHTSAEMAAHCVVLSDSCNPTMLVSIYAPPAASLASTTSSTAARQCLYLKQQHLGKTHATAANRPPQRTTNTSHLAVQCRLLVLHLEAPITDHLDACPRQLLLCLRVAYAALQPHCLGRCCNDVI